MLATVVRGDAYKQEVWGFELLGSWNTTALHLRQYRIEYKKPGQRKWRVQEKWDSNRQGQPNPPLWDAVVTEAKEQLIAQIRGLEIQPWRK